MWRTTRLGPVAALCTVVLLGACGPPVEPSSTAPVAPDPAPTSETPAPTDASAEVDTAPVEVPAPAELVVRFLDVGQGDATLLQAPDATMLIDTGRYDRDDLLGHLRAYGVDHIDVVAITHAHADHIGQLDRILDAISVAEVWMSGTPHTTATFERAVAAIERSEVAYEEPRAGDRADIGSLEVEVLGPEQLTGDLHADTLALRITFGSVRFLFTGDAEAETEAEMVERAPELLGATIYQVGHHGSATSTTPPFLAAVSPEAAVYSAGADNPYGHPHQPVIDRLASAGVAIYGTDRHGTVTITTDGETYQIGAREVVGAARPTQVAAADGCEPGQVDINGAGPGELERVIHINAERAAQIVDLRPFGSVDELARVRGIAEARLSDIKSQGVACVT